LNKFSSLWNLEGVGFLVRVESGIVVGVGVVVVVVVVTVIFDIGHDTLDVETIIGAVEHAVVDEVTGVSLFVECTILTETKPVLFHNLNNSYINHVTKLFNMSIKCHSQIKNNVVSELNN